MAIASSSRDRPEVLIAGGGFAALETALALKALAEDRVQLTVVSPVPILSYRPAATTEAFGSRPPRRYDLRQIARDLQIRYHLGSLETAVPEKHYVGLASGARLAYETLVLAVGARAISAIPGALMFRDQRDVPLLRQLLREIGAGTAGRVAFAVPSGTSWPLPLYELALLSAAHARERMVDAEVSVVSPESEPLEVFGRQASRLVDRLLSERDVRFLGRSAATGVRRDGSLTLQADAPLKVDRVVSVPQLRGHRIPGIPGSLWGFVPVDSFGHVDGVPDVYAAGDMTTFPIKQGGLAAQQADRIAHVIAAALGAPLGQVRADHVLQGRLMGGSHPIVLRTELDWQGLPTAATAERTEGCSLPNSMKVYGRYLGPYLERARPLAA